MSRLILHITTRAAWEAARAAGRYEAPSLTTEGFIHLSDPAQVVRVADARYSGAPDLVLLCVAADRLTAPLRYETSDAGEERFPHLYGALNLDAVVEVVPFPESEAGFALPVIRWPDHDDASRPAEHRAPRDRRAERRGRRRP